MKKLAIVLVALFCAYSTYAQVGYPGSPVTAQTTININVISPIDVVAPTAPELPVVIYGTTRTFATPIPVQFTINGETGVSVEITTDGSDYTDETANVTLVGTWEQTTPYTVALTGGTAYAGDGAATFTYTITGLNATSATTAGTANFKLEVRAEYTGI